MRSKFKGWISILYVFWLVPLVVIGEDPEPMIPTPWTLSQGWWKSLTQDSYESAEARLQKLTQSLQLLNQQVPEDQRNLVTTAVERIQLNCFQFLTLKNAKGWKIESAPEIKAAYTLDEYLLAAKEVKSSQTQLQDMKEEQKRLVATRTRMQAQIDDLYTEYGKTPEKSLQRTLTGLNLMVAVTNRGIFDERIRLTEEELSGIEQKTKWAKGILEQAEERLSPNGQDVESLEGKLTDASTKVKSLDQELLELETGLAASRKGGDFDARPLHAIVKRVILSRALVESYTLHARKGVITVFKPGFDSDQANTLLEKAKGWSKELDKIDKQVSDWKNLIRREQDAAESAFLQDKELSQDQNGKKYENLLNHQKKAQEALINIRDLELELYQGQQVTKIVMNNSIRQLDWFSGFWKRTYLIAENFILGVFDLFSYPLFRINDKPVTLLKIFRAIFIVMIAYWGSNFLRRLFTEVARRKEHVSAASVYTFKRVAHYVILLMGFIWALSSLGIDFSSLMIIAGALSVGIGFGLQGIVNNFLSGLIVLFDRKLRIGDFIELSGGEMGYITEVNVQNTLIRNLDGHDILVPNSDIVTRQLTNWTLRDQYSRFHLAFGVAYGADKEKVREVVEKAAKNIEETVVGHSTIPDPSVWLVGFGDSALNFELVVWVDFRRSKKRQTSLRAAYYWEVETALRENNIEIPFPQRDLHLKTGFDLESLQKAFSGKREN